MNARDARRFLQGLGVFLLKRNRGLTNTHVVLPKTGLPHTHPGIF